MVPRDAASSRPGNPAATRPDESGWVRGSGRTASSAEPREIRGKPISSEPAWDGRSVERLGTLRPVMPKGVSYGNQTGRAV